MKLNESILGNLKEGTSDEQVCVLCGKKFRGWGNDAWPLADGYCCDACNESKVIPARIAQMYGLKEETIDVKSDDLFKDAEFSNDIKKIGYQSGVTDSKKGLTGIAGNKGDAIVIDRNNDKLTKYKKGKEAKFRKKELEVLNKYRKEESVELTEEENKGVTSEEFLDSTVTVYNLNDLIDKINEDEGTNYQVHMGPERALLQDVNGKYILADYEAVRDFADTDNDAITVYLSEKEKEVTNPDGSKTKTFSIVPNASVDITVKDIKDNCKPKQMKARDFFEKYNYNDRCSRNFGGMIDNLNGKYMKKESAELKEGYVGFENYGEGENEFFGSLANTHALELLDSLIKYYSDLVSAAKADPYAFQGANVGYLTQAIIKLEAAKEFITKD